MKGIDLFCASPASTAICVSMDHRSISCSHAGKTIDRQNHRTIDHRRSKQSNPYSQSPSKPRPSFHETSRKSSAKRNELVSPAGSSRYLLTDKAFFDISPLDFDPVPVNALVPVEPVKSHPFKKDESAMLKSSSTRSHEQVVVLRVSLHCKGCELKVRKHISRIPGVTSFDVDLEAKKVTVIGKVTPLGVLASISKVKNAQLWPSSSPSTSSSSSSLLS